MSDTGGKPEIDLLETDIVYRDEDGYLRVQTERIHKGGWKHPDEK